MDADRLFSRDANRCLNKRDDSRTIACTRIIMGSALAVARFSGRGNSTAVGKARQPCRQSKQCVGGRHQHALRRADDRTHGAFEAHVKARMPDHVPRSTGDFELVEAQRLARLGNWRLDFETGSVQWSGALYEIFGIDPSAPAPSYAEHAAIFTTESFTRLDRAISNTIATGTPYTLDLEVRHASGEPRWITARGEAIRDAGGRIVALRGTASDITERQQLLNALAERERALKFSEQRFRASFDSMFQMMAILVPDGTLLEVNEAALAFIDGPASAQLGKRFWDTDWWQISGAVRDGVRDAVARAASGEFVRYDVELTNTRQQRMVVDFSIKPVRDDTGQVVLLVPEGRNVTEERRARETLRKTQERLRAIFDSTFQFIGLLTPEGMLIDVNRSAAQFTGEPSDQLIGRPFWECHWWTHSASTQKRLKEAIQRAAQGEFVRYDTEVQGAGGAMITIDFSLKPIRNDQGRITLLVAEGRDVSEERRTRAALEDSENRFRLAMKNAPIGQALVSLDGHWLSANQALCAMLGYSEAELLAKTLQDITHPDDLVRELESQRALIAGSGDRFQMEKRHYRSDGSVVRVQLDVSLLRDAAGQPLHFISQKQDVTVRRQLEAQQEALNQRLTLALNASGIGVWEWDLSTNLLTWDAALRRIYGVGADEQINYQIWRSAVVAEDLPRAEDTLQDALREKRRGATEFRIVHPKLGVRFIESLFGLVLDSSGEPTRMTGVNLDVTERWLAEQRLNESNRLLKHRIAEVSELQEQLREQAIRDGLTGLYNRRYFDERLASELARAARDGHGVSLIMADLDHFKTINDRFGHPGGDVLLQAWSELLRSNLRATDVLCRYGGEEFVVVLPGSSVADAEVRAEQLRSRFEDLTLPAASGVDSLRTTVSIGVAHAAAGSRTAEQLVRAADAALYRAKTEGRNRVVCEMPSDPAP
eukprot:TRINITY_DN1300_c0_g1_i1.p1 TRINITY_DN1300_c0_g1~~TRINITY_DN1300_c0_g1_i1.p1  ORF type:complete len:939 (+),score=211.47 TRINITY_DN1300_c0_g1_i1:105-2921(+)